MKTALIMGASGLVGKELTKLALADDYYDEVKVLLRLPLDIDHPKLKSVIYDYDQPDTEKVKAHAIFCCLGSTIKKAGSKAAFFRIDHDYVVQTAAIGLENGAQSFSLVSSMGAHPKSAVFYSRSKGLIEQSLQKLAYKGIYIFRPSMLLGERNEKRFGERLAQQWMRYFSCLIPPKYKAIAAKQVARAMIETAKNARIGYFIIENDSIAKI